MGKQTGEQETWYLKQTSHLRRPLLAPQAICITRVKAQTITLSDKLMVLLKSTPKGDLDQDRNS